MAQHLVAPTHRTSAHLAPAVVVIANANARSATRRLDRVMAALRRLGVDADAARTADLRELADTWTQADAERVILVGGDGTVHAAANQPGPARDIALVPAGHADNVAHSLGIPCELERAVALAVGGRVRPVDLIEARAEGRTRRVVEGVSAGVLARARESYRGRGSGNLPSAVAAGAGALIRYAPLAATCVGDAAQEEHLSLGQVFVANLPLYAFGLCVAPHADPADATLDLIGIEAPTRRAVLRALHAIRRGRLLGLPGVHLWRAQQAWIATHGSSPVIGDSTSLGYGPVLLRPVPGGLRLVRP